MGGDDDKDEGRTGTGWGERTVRMGDEEEGENSAREYNEDKKGGCAADAMRARGRMIRGRSKVNADACAGEGDGVAQNEAKTTSGGGVG